MTQSSHCQGKKDHCANEEQAAEKWREIARRHAALYRQPMQFMHTLACTPYSDLKTKVASKEHDFVIDMACDVQPRISR
eukprot:3285074-Pleurochrysis_carterae.AAC.3